MGCTGDAGCKEETRARSTGERCDRFPGAADARRSTPRLRGPASQRPACHKQSDWRVGRAGPSRSVHWHSAAGCSSFSGPASGVASGRGDDLSGAQHTQQSGVPDRDGQFVSALFRAQREGSQARGPRPREGPLPKVDRNAGTSKASASVCMSVTTTGTSWAGVDVLCAIAPTDNTVECNEMPTLAIVRARVAHAFKFAGGCDLMAGEKKARRL